MRPMAFSLQDDPLQVNVAQGETLQMGRWTLTVRATYQVTARVLAREAYHFDALVRFDARGLGAWAGDRCRTTACCARSRFLSPIAFITGAPRPERRSGATIIITHSANTHVIPQNSLVARPVSSPAAG